ncbi:MAG TPA: CheR family methyltransferase [Urbifossiella sp.]|jgi:chemotaxis protein methyltransferase CheR|nr:CheR family methyltransferase [Urbifossiella sp.]
MTGPPDRDLLDRFRDAVAQRLGLDFDDSKRPLLADVLVRQAARTGGGDAAAYTHRLSAGLMRRDEAAQLAEELTVGETYFFRHPDQFRALTDVVAGRPAAEPAGRRLHILSAGCASGDEAYSLAVLVRETVPAAAGWDVRVVGIDVNPAAVARATRARYTAWSLRGCPDDFRQRYFRAADKEYVLDGAVHSMVSFEVRNLLDDAPDFWRPAAYDVIFCRNVLMYFTPAAMRAAVARLTHALAPGGHLFLGPAETLRGVSPDYHLRHTHDTFYYQRRPHAGATGAGPPAADAPAAAPPEESWAAASDDSWVTAIGRASERITRLSRERHPPAPPGQPPAPPPGRVPAAGILAAREMLRQERYPDALSALVGLPAEAHGDPEALLLRAVILTHHGQVADADRLCHEILAGDELNAEARYLLALCLEHAGDFAAAAEQDRTAVYLDPRFAMPHLHLGRLGKRAGDHEAARRAFRQAAALLPAEDPSRLLLFGGGFSREMLLRLCEAEARRGGDQ